MHIFKIPFCCLSFDDFCFTTSVDENLIVNNLIIIRLFEEFNDIRKFLVDFSKILNTRTSALICLLKFVGNQKYSCVNLKKKINIF